MKMAFKEWAVVCDALGAGRQSVLVRKGGIAEGRAGFEFRHREFFLFPTWFHEQLARTTLPPDTVVPSAPESAVDIRYAVKVDWTGLITDLEKASRLAEFHVLDESVVEERFRYDDADGVHVAFVRAYRLDPSRMIRLEKRHGGCRSWLELPEAAGSSLVPVVSDEEHARCWDAFRAVVGLE